MTVILFKIRPPFDTGGPPDSVHESFFASFKVVSTSLSSLASSLQQLQPLIHIPATIYQAINQTTTTKNTTKKSRLVSYKGI